MWKDYGEIFFQFLVVQRYPFSSEELELSLAHVVWRDVCVCVCVCVGGDDPAPVPGKVWYMYVAECY